ncbi:hypothetical protein MYA_5192 [Burkholderia sp. KJ006]|nr:hypothetical protein MYA_5192 [Burkholderia sp. KJ006]
MDGIPAGPLSCRPRTDGAHARRPVAHRCGTGRRSSHSCAAQAGVPPAARAVAIRLSTRRRFH